MIHSIMCEISPHVSDSSNGQAQHQQIEDCINSLLTISLQGICQVNTGKFSQSPNTANRKPIDIDNYPVRSTEATCSWLIFQS